MEELNLEQEVTEVIEALRSQEGRTLLQFLDATAPRLQEIHLENRLTEVKGKQKQRKLPPPGK